MKHELFLSLKDGQIQNRAAFSKRTSQQNRYLHGVLFPELAQAFVDAGYDGMNEVVAKEWAKRRFLTMQIVNKDTGEFIEYTKHTRELSTIELNEFIEDVIRFAAESLSYEIPYPNEQIRLNC